jgi:hypothetical protein
MVVRDFNILGAVGTPNETDAPLTVYPDRVLARSVPLQRFKTIGGRNTKVFQVGSGLKHRDFTKGNFENTTGKTFAGFSAQYLLDQFTPGALDHVLYVSLHDACIKGRYGLKAPKYVKFKNAGVWEQSCPTKINQRFLKKAKGRACLGLRDLS